MSSRLLLTLLLPVACFAAPGPAAAAEPAVRRGAESSRPVAPVSFDGDLRELPPAREWKPGEPMVVVPRRIHPRPGDPRATLAPGTWGNAPQEPEGWHDPLLDQQGEATTDPVFGSPGLNFDAFSFNGVYPPDTNGDASPSHYIAAANAPGVSNLRIYGKNGSLVGSEFSLRSLWTNGGPCAEGAGDPIVLYDHLAGRWFFSEFIKPAAGNRLCVYVSKTSDPVTGGFWLYEFPTPNFPDYPKYAVWPDAYYATANEDGSALYALDRARMLSGQPAAFQRFQVASLRGFPFDALEPVDLDGSTPPPAGSPGLFLRPKDEEVHGGPTDGSKDVLELFAFQVDWANPGNSTLTGPLNITVAEFSSELCGLVSFECVPQPGTSRGLDPLREPVMWRTPYRNFGSHESIVGTYTVDAGDFTDHHAPRWFELRRTPPGAGDWTVYQEGIVAPDDTHRWMGSIAMDGMGNIALAYSVSNPGRGVFPGIRYTGRLAGDPLGTMGAESSMVAGAGSQTSLNRWGDYSAMAIDPADDCRFWFTTEYMPGAFWRTRVASFEFGSCAAGSPSVAFATAGSTTLGEDLAGAHDVAVRVSTASGSSLAAPVTVAYATSPGTAKADGDYSHTAGTLTFAAGTAAGATQIISIPILADTRDEPNETFTVTLSGAAGATLGAATHTVTIPDDDVPAVSASASTASAGQSLNAMVAAGPGNARDWIALARVGSPDSSFATWRYLNGLQTPPGSGFISATVPFTMPAPAGNYEFRFFSNDGFARLAASGPIAVVAPAPRVTPSATTASTGGTVNAVVNNGPGNATDWLALAATSAADTAYVDWRYLNGLQTPPGSGLASASVAFTMPATPGTYEFRLFASNGFTRLATGAAITVNAAAGPSLAASTATAAAGQSVNATVSNGPASPTDWVALALAGSGNTTYLDWRYLNGAQTPPGGGLASASVPFVMPAAGSFEFRLFASNGFTRLATSGTITVSGPTVTAGASSPTFGQVVSATVASGPANPTDWVALALSSAGNTAYVDWKYLNGQQTPPGSGLSAATVNFTMPSVAGSYEFRLFAHNSFTRLATSAGIQNSAGAPPSVNASTSTATAGATVNAIVANGPANATDWIALALTSAGNTSYTDWRYLNGAQTPPGAGLTAATVPFTMPSVPGSYEFRLFANNGAARLATSGAITVGSPRGE